MFLFTLVLTMNAPVPDAKQLTPSALTVEEQACARKAIYEGSLISVSPKRDFDSVLQIPEVLTAMYKKNPAAVRDLLIRIADGGSPHDSIRAVSYLIEMADGPGSGELVASLFSAASYDSVDKDWGHAPREHWLKHLRGKLTK